MTQVCRNSRRILLLAGRERDNSYTAEAQATFRKLRRIWNRLAIARGRRGIPRKRVQEPVAWLRSSSRTSRRLDYAFRISHTLLSESGRFPILERARRRLLRPSPVRSPGRVRVPFPAPQHRLPAWLRRKSTARL